MKTTSRLIALVLLALFLTGCASSRSGDVYSRDQARREMTIRYGVVESVREVRMEGTRSGAGTIAGAAVGGVAGSTLGKGKGQLVGAILGAVAGGVAGSVAEDRLTEKNALEISVKLDNGHSIAVVQEKGDVFHPGDRVRVLSDHNASRVAH